MQHFFPHPRANKQKLQSRLIYKGSGLWYMGLAHLRPQYVPFVIEKDPHTVTHAESKTSSPAGHCAFSAAFRILSTQWIQFASESVLIDRRSNLARKILETALAAHVFPPVKLKAISSPADPAERSIGNLLQPVTKDYPLLLVRFEDVDSFGSRW
jgi:hypothetical protein